MPARKKAASPLEGLELYDPIEGSRRSVYETAPTEEGPGVLRSAGDSAIALGAGALKGAQMLSNIAGADNPVSQALGAGTEALYSLESPQRQAEKQRRAQLISEAEKSGSPSAEIGAYIGSFLDAPLDSLLDVVGTAAPTIGASVLAPGAIAPRALALGVGALQGVGETKGQIYQQVEQAALQAGMPAEEARIRATAAQAYLGENRANLAGAAAIGALGGATGMEGAILGRAAGRAAAHGAAQRVLRHGAGEMFPEGLQEGQQQYAGNVAEQRAGFDTPTWQGVAGSAALGAVAGFGAGGAFGAAFPERAEPAGPLTRAADTALGAQAGAEAAATRLLSAPPAQPAEWEVVNDRPQLPGGAARLALGFEPEAVEPTIMVDSRGNAARAPDEWVRQADAQRAADAEMGLTPDVRAAQARRAQGEADGAGEDLGGAAAGVSPAGDLAARNGGTGEALRAPEPGRVGVVAPGVEGSDAAGGAAVRGQPEPDDALSPGNVATYPQGQTGNVTTPDESIDARIDAAGRDWWAGMEPAARADALKAAGVTGYSEKSPWARISKRNRARLNGVRLQAEGLARAESQQAGIIEPKKPARTREQASAERKRAYREANPFRSFLAEHGINVADRSDTGAERNRPVMVPFHGPLYRRNGMRLDELARRAVEAGFLTQADVDSDLDNGGVNKLSDMIRRDLAGERILPVTAAESEQEAEWRAQMDARYEAMQEAEEAIAALTDDEINALLQLASDEDAELRNEEIDVALEPGEAQEAGGRAQETAAGAQARGDSGRGAAARDESPGEVGRPDFGLDRQSADDVRRQEEQRRKDEAKAEREAQEQARRDAAPPAGDFTLTGSNRPADEAAARGQQELAPAPEPEAKSAPKEDAAAPPKRKGTKAQRDAEAEEAARADYFKPGNIIRSYSGFDRVLEYKPPEKPGGEWSVKVEAVRKDGDEWVAVGRPQDARWHSTQPDARELAQGPVERASNAPEQPATETRDGQPVGRDEPLTIGEIPNTGDFEADTTKYLTEVLPETFTLYRSVWIGNGEKPNLDDPGSYWAETPEGARRSGFPPTGQKNRQVILDVRASRSDIDVRQSIARRRQYGEPEIVLKSPPGKARVFALPTGGQPIGRDGLTDTERESNRLDGIADDLARQIDVESSERDFAPSEIPSVIEQWAKDNEVDTGELRTRVLDRLRKRLSEGRMRQVEQALSGASKPAPPMIGEIDRGLATQAFEGTSHTPDRRGESARSEYVRLLRDAWNEAVEIAGDDPAAIDRIRDEFEKLRDGYKRRYEAYLRAHSRVMSSMIVGPARFPTERNRKRGDAADKRANEANDFLRKGIARLKKAARAPIDNTPTGEVERIRKSLAERERAQEQMKAANAALRKGDDAALREIGFSEAQIAELKKPDFAGRNGFPSYRLTNNQAEIRRLRERLAQAEGRVETAAAGPTSQQVGGARVEEDAEANRIRLYFDGKPDEATRTALKKAGFRWAPSVGAWQRQLTDNARRAAREILGGETGRGLAIFEPTAQYRVDEPQDTQADLFGVPGDPGENRPARSGRARVRRDVQPAPALSDTEAPAGEYFLRTVLGTETTRQLGASVIKTHADAARATKYLYRNAVERFDGIVTDKDGKPLAVVGGFKGDLAQSAIYPPTLIGEAVRIPGAARIWFSHNHPSGTAELSSADRALHRALNHAFRGSGIEPMGLLAVAGDSYAVEAVGTSGFPGDAQSNLPIKGKEERVGVPVVERMIAPDGVAGTQITSPTDAKTIGAIFYNRTKEPGLVLLNAQNRVVAWVPLPSNMIGKLRGTGGLRALYRSVSESTVGGAIIVQGGELSAHPGFSGVSVVQNIGAALKEVGVTPLDAINVITGHSAAEHGASLASGPVFSRGERTGGGMFIPAVESIVKRVRDGWANGPEVVIVADLTDPKVPQSVREAAQSRQADTGDFEAEGFFLDGTVYLVADSLDSEADVVRVLLHEAAGHYGLRGLFGDRLNSILEQIVRSKPKAVADKMREYGLTGAEGRLIAAEEVLARMAEKNPKMGFVRRAIAAIRSWLREIGFDLRLSDSEIIRDIVLPARRYVTYGAPRNPGRGSWLGASLNQSGADKLISDHSSADAEMLSDLASSESFLEKGFRGIDVPRQRVVLGAVRRVIKQLQIADAVIELIPVDVMDMLRGEQGAANMALHDEAMLENLLSVEGNKPITIPVDGATALVRATALAAAERMRVDQLRRDFVAVGAAEGALDRDASRSRGGATASAATADIRPFGLGRPGRVEVEGRPALGTLEGRHDVTPESDVVLGADGGDTPSAPPIISVPARQWVESGTAANVAGVPLFSRRATQKKLSDSIADLFASSKGFNWWHRTIGTQYEKAQRNAHFKRVFDTAQEFLNDVSDFGNRAADAAPSLLPKLDGIRDAFKKPPSKRDLSAIARPIFDGTLMNEDPHKGRVWTDAELREKYGLNDRQIGLYREFRAAVDRSLDDMGKTDLLRYAGKDASAVRDRVLAAPSVGEAARILSAHLSAAAQANPKRADALNDTAATVREKAQSIEGLKRGGYAPLMRFGRFSVYVTREGKGEPEQLYFGMFETQRDANIAARRLRAEFPDATVQQGVMSQEAFKLFQGVNPDTLEIFADVAGIEKTEAFQQYLKLARANRSAMKRLIHRKGTAGFSEDVTRVLASFITSNARAGSMNLHTGELNEAVAAIPKEQGDVRDEGVKLAEFTRGTNDPSSKLRGLLFMQFLGGSVASAVVNMTQPITMTYPYLARFVGAGRAGTMLTKAMRDAVTGVGSDADLAAALKRAEREGIVSPQEIHHLYAEGGVGLSRNPLVRRATLVWGSFFSAAEQFNRRASFIAAYRIARAQKEANPYAFATHAVEETQGIYSRANRPNWSRNPVGATVLTFKQFSIHYVEFLKRLPVKQQALALVVLALAAGLEELPFADDVDDAVDTIAHALGYNWSSKRAKREWLAKTIGADASEFVLKGAQAIHGFPLGLSARLGLGNLVPGTGMLLGSTRDRSREITEVVGVAGSFAQTAIDAAGKALAGDAAGAAQEVMPLAVKNVLKGLDMYQTGMYRDSRGRRVMDVGGYESLVKAIGFQPAGVSAAQDRASIAQQQAAHVRNVQQQFSERMALARFERDADALRSAREDMREWNRKNPKARIQVSEASINARLKSMRATRAERIEKAAPRAIRAALDL